MNYQIFLAVSVHVVAILCSLGMVVIDVYLYIAIKSDNATLLEVNADIYLSIITIKPESDTTPPQCTSAPFKTRVLQFIELSGYTLIDALRCLTFGIFIWYAGRRLFCKNFWALLKNCKWSILLLATPTLLVALDILIFGLTFVHFESCSKRNSIIKRTISVLNLVSLISLSIMTFQASRIVYSSIDAWDTSKLEEIILTIEDIDKKVRDLYNDYREKGEKIKLKCNNILKHWYVVIYVMYLLYIFVTAIHVVRNVYEQHERDYPDIIGSTLASLVYFIAFYLPYFMGITLNKKHKKYYSKMMEVIQMLLDTESGNLVQIDIEEGTKKPVQRDSSKEKAERSDSEERDEGKPDSKKRADSEETAEHPLQIQLEERAEGAGTQSDEQDSDLPTAKLLNPASPENTEPYKQKVQNQDKSKVVKRNHFPFIEKIDDFDLVPSLFNTDIRLEGNGYTVPIIIAIVSFVIRLFI